MTTRSQPAQSPGRMLVFRTGQLGDMIASLPAMWVIRQKWPQAELTLLCDVHPGRNYVLGSAIFQGAGLFDRYDHYDVPADGDGRLKTMLKKTQLLLRLRRRGFDALFYLLPSIRSRAQVERDRRFFRAAGITRFYGMDFFPAVPFRNAPRPLPAAGHEADLILARLKADGLAVPAAGKGSLDLGVGKREQDEVVDWLRDLPADGGRKWIGVGPASKMPAKRWPLERFSEVVRALISRFDIWPVVFGGPEDRAIGDSLVGGWGRGYNAAGALGVRAAVAALKQCVVYLGNDSGTMHLAAAAQTPCVAVFSSRDWPGSWYPYGVPQRVFRTEIECEGCYLTECVERKNACLNRITVAEVAEACSELLMSRG